MKLNPCFSLSFDGRCEEAFRFYERCFPGKIQFLLAWKDSPMANEVPPAWGDKVFHATLVVGTATFTGSDARPGTYQSPRGFSITLNMDDPAEAERVFSLLASGGTVRMPLQDTFWAPRFGVVVDQFGIQWEVNCEKPTQSGG
jgi:PhnB protein